MHQETRCLKVQPTGFPQIEILSENFYSKTPTSPTYKYFWEGKPKRLAKHGFGGVFPKWIMNFVIP